MYINGRIPKRKEQEELKDIEEFAFKIIHQPCQTRSLLNFFLTLKV